MSSNGKARALLEARRREEIRKEIVRNKCKSIINEMNNQIENMSSGEIQEVQSDLSKLRAVMITVENNLTNNPDNSFEDIQKVIGSISVMVNKSKTMQENWNEIQIKWQNKLSEVQIYAQSLANSKYKIAKGNHQTILEKIDILMKRGFTEDYSDLNNIKSEIDNIYEKIEEEEVRRELVKSLRKTFSDLGFSSANPKVKNGQVSLIGTLPSGKKASFLVNQDGTFDFEFEGYNGTACKDTLDEIQLTLKKSTKTETEIIQFQWHDPKLKYKQAKSFPTGSKKQRSA